MSKRYEWINGETYCDSDQMYDNETGNKTQPVYVADLLNEQDQKIKDLEAKLAEMQNEKTEENNQLKQQLHSQPAEIVGKIRSKCCVEDKCKDGSFVLGINEKDLDTILKEYQKEEDKKC